MKQSRQISRTETFFCSLEDIWKKWSTEEGLQSFFSDHCHVEWKVGGAFEMYFRIENEKGFRGSEGCRILAMEEKKFFSFTWNAPPLYPQVRAQNTFVSLHFREIEEGRRCELELNHYGWGTSETWTQVYNYFVGAWEKTFHDLRDSLEIS